MTFIKDIYLRNLVRLHLLIYGYVVVALIQGLLGAFGFFIFGIHSPIFWGIVMTITALIPFIGTAIVWLPFALIKLFNGILANNTNEIIGGILFILYGTIIISGIDNVLRPKIIGDKAKVHPILILVGVLGGLSLFGFIGVVIGPLILALFVAFLTAYEENKPK